MSSMRWLVPCLVVGTFAGCNCQSSTEADLGAEGSGGGQLTFTTVFDGPDPAPQYVALKNSGSCPLSFVADPSTSTGGDWLLNLPRAGTIAPLNQFDEPGRTTISVTPTGRPSNTPLPAGTYQGKVTVVGTCTEDMQPAANSPVDILVTLIITAPPVDAGVDAGFVVDAGRVDSGVDAGPVDAGVDAGPLDAGPLDAGRLDAGFDGGVDAGPAVVTGRGTCADPFVSPFPIRHSATLVGPSAYDNTCRQLESTGPERFYTVTTPTSGRLVARVTGVTGGVIPTVMLASDCVGTSYQTPFGCQKAQVPNEPITMWVENLPANTYTLVVDGLPNQQLGAAADAGSYTLEVTFDPAPTYESTATSCANERLLVLVDGGAVVESHTNGSTDDGLITHLNSFGTPLNCSPGGTFQGLDRNYRLVVPGTESTAVEVTLLTLNEANGNGKLVVLPSCDGDGGSIACRDVYLGDNLGEQARYAGVFDAGTSLSLRVEGYAMNIGGFPYRLEVKTAPVRADAGVTPPLNDQCGVGVTTLSLNTSVAGSTLGANDDRFSYSPVSGFEAQCPAADSPGADVFYRFVAPATGQYTFSVQPTRGFRPALYVLSSCGGGCLSGRGSEGVTPTGVGHSASVTLTANQEVFVAVDSKTSPDVSHDRGGFIVSVQQ